MNIYEKIARARVLFQSLNKKQSGKNSFANYSYFELSDILPEINKIGSDLGFVCIVSFSDIAQLEVVNTEDPADRAVFTSPMSAASLKGCHDVQNLGAVQTYIKRYLYQNAFEIVEADALNATHNPNEKTASKTSDRDVNLAKIAEIVKRGVLTENQVLDVREKAKFTDASAALKLATVLAEEWEAANGHE